MPAIPAALDRRLRELRDATLPLFDLPERQLGRRYRRGGWTAREVLVHIADCETVYLDRIRRIIAQDKPLLTAFDQDGWADRLGYAGRDLGVAQSLFVAARSSIIELLDAHRAEADRVGIHTEVGVVTLGQIAEKVANHNQHHLAQVRQATGA